MRSLALIVLTIGASAGDPAPAPPDAAEPVELSEVERKRIRRHAPLPAPPADPTNRFADDAGAAHLGRHLFFEQRFSSNGEVSCATCHDPAKSFADGLEVAEAVGVHHRHTPSLWNVAHNRWQFWDGRVDTLWSQALKPIETPVEYNGNRLQVVHLVARDPDLRRGYEAVFGPMPDLSDPQRFPPEGRPVPDDPDHPWHVVWTGMTADDRETVNRVFSNLGKAIAAYERRLVSNDAPFDRFARALQAEDGVPRDLISASAIRGLKLFIGRANCRFCHVGPNFTDGEFHNTGIPPRDGGPPRDPGRFAGAEIVLSDPFNAAGPYSDMRSGEPVDKLESMYRSPESWGQFKTPSLRNVAVTAPYMHQGQLATLREVVEFYSTLERAVVVGHHQETILQPLHLTEREMDDLIAFLETLTDQEIDPELLEPPQFAAPERE